jgi:hypothetical protein
LVIFPSLIYSLSAEIPVIKPMTSAEKNKFILINNIYINTILKKFQSITQQILTNQKFIIMVMTTNFSQGCETQTKFRYGRVLHRLQTSLDLK